MNHTPAQLAFINSQAHITVAIAGPGSGKTQAMTDRIKRLIADGCPASEIVAISFTNEAAHQLSERVGIKLGFCGTLHSWIFRLLMRHGTMIGLSPQLTILDEDEAASFLEQTLIDMKIRAPLEKVREAIAKGPQPNDFTHIGLAVNGYYQKLRERGVVDYDAMLVFGDRLIDKLPALGTHLFVDEVQDSGDLDFSIYRKAMFRFKTLIGDPDQAIFGFRGGVPKHLLSLTNHPDVEVFRLETNFRSDLEICDAAQQLIEHNRLRYKKKTISASEELGEILFEEEFESGAGEVDFIRREIEDLRNQRHSTNEIAILCRTNALCDHFRTALQIARIPVSQKERQQMPADWSLCKLLITFLCNPENNHIAAKVLRLVKGIEVSAKAEKDSLMAFSSVNQLNFQATVPAGPDTVKVLRHYNVSENSLALVAATAANLDADFTIQELALALSRELAPTQMRGDGVSVLTIHAAKGLEWDTVFLPAFEDETIPGTRKNLDIEEERRLAFVAVTRARHRLYVTHAAQRQNPYGHGMQKRTPSRYLMELEGTR